jgi:hypothetical protein
MDPATIVGLIGTTVSLIGASAKIAPTGAESHKNDYSGHYSGH